MYWVKLVTMGVLLSISAQIYAQPFSFQSDKSYEEFHFKSKGNLIFLPVVVNGVEMNFILDSGVNKTVILSLSKVDSLPLNHVEEMFLTGLGSKEPFKVVYSENNTIKIGNLVDTHHEVFILIDEASDFSRFLGVEVHGIIGYDILKDFIVEIDYDKELIRFYPEEKYKKRKKRKEVELPIEFFKRKPYVTAEVGLADKELKQVTLLLDTGSSDAVWLFKSDTIQVTEPNFSDYLGVGLSGDIVGKRTKIPTFGLGGMFELNEVKCAFPDTEYMINLKRDDYSNGSIGAELLSRFLVTINYKEKWVRLRKGHHYKKPFYYNMSGIIVRHNGVRFVEEHISNGSRRYDQNASQGVTNTVNYTSFFQEQVQYHLTEAIEIAELREGSPAAIAGLRKGDVLLRINNKVITNQSMEEIQELLNTKPGKKIKLLVNRGGEEMKFVFILKKLL
ncbi:aspartyl protease family protein [Neptunitalea lumnitzerae]